MIPPPQRPVAELLRRLTGGAEPIETHVSAVFVGPDAALKLKKAVRLGFLDFTDLAARERFTRRELEVNRPFAPGLYRDALPVVRAADGALALGGEGVAAWTAVSRSTADQWTRLRGRVQVVRNGVDSVAWPLGPGGDRLVWSGRLVPEKAPHLAVDAARAAGRPLVLAGPVGDPVYVREVLAPYAVELVDSAPGALPGLSAPAAAHFVAALGGTPVAKYGWTDVARFASLGIPAVNFGPGDPNLAHTREESVETARITAAERALRAYLS